MRRAFVWMLPAALAGFLAAPAWAEPPEGDEPLPAETEDATDDRAGEPPAGSDDEAQGARVAGWVRDLGSSDTSVRQRAERQLRQSGEAARVALREAVRSDANSDVRMRARHLLVELDASAGTMPAEDDTTPPTRRTPRGDDTMPADDDTMAPGRRTPRGTDQPQGFEEEPPARTDRTPSPAATTPTTRIQLEGLAYERTGGRARLVVTDEQGRRRTYAGAGLEAILRENPDLRGHASLPALRQELRVRQREAAGRFEDRGAAVTFTEESRLEVTRSGDFIVARVFERPGAPPRMLRARTVAELSQRYPALRTELRSWTYLDQPGAVVDQPGAVVAEMPGEAYAPHGATGGDFRRFDDAPFGVVLGEVSPCLASQLQLHQAGAVITEVRYGTQAAALGLQQHDVILSVNGNQVGSVQDANVFLRSAGRSDRGTTVVVMRNGQQITLPR